MLARGNLYRFNYLWSREHRRGEISGRKARPVCLILRSSARPEALFLFPITSQQPLGHSYCLPISEQECRHAGLDYPSWIVVEEYNRVNEPDLYDFESLAPIGRFSDAFVRRIAEAVARVAAAERLVAVPRT